MPHLTLQTPKLWEAKQLKKRKLTEYAAADDSVIALGLADSATTTLLGDHFVEAHRMNAFYGRCVGGSSINVTFR